MTNLTKITADEQAGIAFTLLLLAQTEKGQLIFDQRFDENDNVDVDNTFFTDENIRENHSAERNHCTTYQNFDQVVEMLLSFHAWYKSKNELNWNESSYDIILNSVREMLSLIKTTLPRKEGYGQKIQKFHELLHAQIDVKCVENFLFKTLLSDVIETTYNVYNSIKIDGTIYRTNPSFRGNAWYDWAVIRFEVSDEDKQLVDYNKRHNTVSAYPAGYYPAKLLAFIKTNNTIKVIIHQTESKKESIHDSCLTERFYLEQDKKIVTINRQTSNKRNIIIPKFRIVDVKSIHERIYVVEETPGIHSEIIMNRDIDEKNKKNNLVIHVKIWETWGNVFYIRTQIKFLQKQRTYNTIYNTL